MQRSASFKPIAALLPFLLSAGCVGSSSLHTSAGHGQLTAVTSPSLVGTWRVVRFCEVDSLRRPIYPLGDHPRGTFIYSPNGQLSLQAIRAPGDSAGRDLPHLGRVEGYFGYFGTYTITSDTTVIHHVTGGTLPDFIDKDQPRRYRIWGPQRDSLTIGPNRTVMACRVLTRIKEN